MHELEAIYRKRKRQLLPLIFGFAAIFVIIRIVLPQWADIQEAQTLLTTKNNTVKVKEDTLSFLNSIPDEEVEGNYTLVTTALPTQKDIILIFSELNDASVKAQVKLGGFTLKVGGIYSAKKEKTTTEQTVEGVPFLNILINVSGKSNNLKAFADVLYKSLPLVEIKSVSLTKNDARYDVNFYFKPVALKSKNAETTALKALGADEKQQLVNLKSWQSPPLGL